jgi:hypothetical protein
MFVAARHMSVCVAALFGAAMTAPAAAQPRRKLDWALSEFLDSNGDPTQKRKVVASAGNFRTNPDAGEIGFAGTTSPGNAPAALTAGAYAHNVAAGRDDQRTAYCWGDPFTTAMDHVTMAIDVTLADRLGRSSLGLCPNRQERAETIPADCTQRVGGTDYVLARTLIWDGIVWSGNISSAVTSRTSWGGDAPFSEVSAGGTPVNGGERQ